MINAEFKGELLEKLKDAFGENVELQIHQVRKNNGAEWESLSIKEQDSALSMELHFEPFYQMWKNGKDTGSIVSCILQVYSGKMKSPGFDVPELARWEKVKDRIIAKLINYEKNEGQLCHVPHVRVLDMAAVFCCLLRQEGGEMLTMQVTDRLAEQWGVGTDELYARSLVNMPVLLGHTFRSMLELLKGLDMPCAEALPEMPPEIYVLSNREGQFGAACLIYPRLMEKLVGEMACDFYILPSSIHELLLIPAGEAEDREEARQMLEIVKNVNRQGCVSAEDFLADNVYYLDRRTGQVTEALAGEDRTENGEAQTEDGQKEKSGPARQGI